MSDLQKFLLCSGCGDERHRCQRLWREQKKCCPDCTHTPTYPLNLKPMELEPYYSRHVADMTGEQLHAKSDIAAQLAWRDKRIAELEALAKSGKACPQCGSGACSVCGYPDERYEEPSK